MAFFIKIVVGLISVFSLIIVFLVIKDKIEIAKVDRILNRKEKGNE